MNLTLAGVAELADATDSKSVARKGVWVRPPPPVGLFFGSVPTDQQKFPSPARYFPLFGIKLLTIYLS